MSYQVLLGANDEALERRVRTLFSELPDFDLADVGHTSSDVSAMVSTVESVDCLLLHEAIGPLPVLDLVRELTARYPHLAIVLAVSDPRAEVLASAMESGARGVVSVDPSLEELEARLGNAADWSRTMLRHFEGASSEGPSGQAGSIVVLAGAKGGTGTTTTAIHVALAAANARRSVCLVDLDLQTGDLATFLDVTHRRSVVDLAEAADDLNPTALSEALFAHRLGFHVLLAPRDGERAEEIDGRAARQILGTLRARYDLVVVDCGAYTSEASAMAAELADRAIIATSPDLPSLRGARRMAEMWERLKIRKREDVAVLVTRQSKQAEIQPDFVGKVLKLKVLNTTIPAVFRALESAINTGTPNEVTEPVFRKAVGRLLGEINVLHGAPSSAGRPEPHSGSAKNDSGKSKSWSQAARKKKRKRESGQATVEFIGMLPYIVIFMVVLWEALLFGSAMMAASHGANEGARAAAVGKSQQDVEKAAKEQMMDTWSERADVEYQRGGEQVTVRLRIPVIMPAVELPWQMSASARVVHET